MAIFKGQSNITISLDADTNISTATDLKILYRKPDYTCGEWAGTLDGTQIIKYTVVDETILDQFGTWWVQIKCTMGGKIIYGNKVKMMITNTLEDPLIP